MVVFRSNNLFGKKPLCCYIVTKRLTTLILVWNLCQCQRSFLAIHLGPNKLLCIVRAQRYQLLSRSLRKPFRRDTEETWCARMLPITMKKYYSRRHNLERQFVIKRNKMRARLWTLFGFVGYRSERNAQARPTDLHALPDARTRKRIPHEPLPHQAEADRDGTLSLPDGTADQDLVPESADEAEEGVTGDQGAERTGEAGAGAEGSGSSGRGCAPAASGRWGTGGGQLGVRPAPEPPWPPHHQSTPPSASTAMYTAILKVSDFDTDVPFLPLVLRCTLLPSLLPFFPSFCLCSFIFFDGFPLGRLTC